MQARGISKADIVTFLKLSEEIPVIDVRSPSEYNRGHIPSAINIPLFDDEERAVVGTLYKKEGREKALMKGLDITGPQMSEKLNKALSCAKNGCLLGYCWRGGLRSEAMAWLFSLGGISTHVLDGGYKSYRHHVHESLSGKKKLIILGGMTGSGKTEILKYLNEKGEQIIDLEGIANHKGSAFGSLGQLPQPSSEHFENKLFDRWKEIDEAFPVWIEDESRNIGSVFLPENFFFSMKNAPAVVLLMDLKIRLPRLMKEYSGYDPEILKTLILKIGKRLGGDKTRDAVNAIEKGNTADAIELILSYYDKAYLYGLKQKDEKNVYYVKTDKDDVEINAKKILDVVSGIKY
jgi:tRNA 2-selenouridine synthase